jgi:hypothetical protein
MGMKLFSDAPTVMRVAPNPDPKNFQILSSVRLNGFLIVEAYYPDATTFEGKKIMVYRGVANVAKLLEVTKQSLDPHFSEGPFSPIARFAPTREGRLLAEAMARAAESA